MKIKFASIQIFAFAILLNVGSSLYAQSDTLPAISISSGVDLMSRYIWRGQEYGQAPSIQPGFSTSWMGYTLGVWGAYKFTGPGIQETDFYVSKTFGPITLALWDYWSFCDTSAMDFFNYDRQTTAHLLEAQVLLSGGEILPLNLLAGYFFYGADSSKSVYLELQYLFSLGNNDIVLFAGFQANGDYYAHKAAFVNIGCTASKSIAVTDRWSLPINLSLILNPYSNSVYLVAGITL